MNNMTKYRYFLDKRGFLVREYKAHYHVFHDVYVKQNGYWTAYHGEIYSLTEITEDDAFLEIL